MSNAALRQRRTVPLTFSSHHKDEEGEHSVPTEESSLRSGSLSAGSCSHSGSGSGPYRARKKKSEVSVSARRLDPIRGSFSNDRSGHSRNSSASGPKASVSTKELKREMMAKKRAGERRTSTSSDPRTPSGRNHLFSIGNDQNAVDLLPDPIVHRGMSGASSGSQQESTGSGGDMPDRYGIEQAGLRKHSFGERERSDSLQKSSFVVRTPFEVDAPRGETPNPRSNRALGILRSTLSSEQSVTSEPTTNNNLSEEQDAWAGIDELLEIRSMDGSFAFSTSDILPKATVTAMRRQRGGLTGVDEETVWGDNDENDEEDSHSEYESSRNYGKKSLEAISKTASTSKNDDPQESFNSRDEKARPSGGDGGLFNMFQWSEKDNVDEQRRRKGKLNSKPRRVKLLAPLRQSEHGSDTASLPSLATIRADEFSVRSGAHSLDWDDTYHSKELGSVVTENTRDEFGFDSAHSSRHQTGSSLHSSRHRPVTIAPVLEESSESESASTQSHSSFANDGLVLDKGVDEYIRKIQSSLPTISEHEKESGKKSKKKKNVGFIVEEEEEETSPSPTSVIPSETAFDELPSLTSLSGHSLRNSTQPDLKASGAAPRKGRMEEKKEPKPSLTFLMNSFKKMTTRTSKNQKQLGDEEKYFPDGARDNNKSKKFRDNRCLLSQGDDGVNWDAD